MKSCGHFGASGAGPEKGLAEFRWTVKQVLGATGGALLAGEVGIIFRKISTDTRTIGKGDLFIALVGERFDGHDFVEDALSKGAIGVLISRPVPVVENSAVILVGDTLKALGDLASWRRMAAAKLSVIAITGSAGKTTVKEMTAAIISIRHSVLKTSGNLNNLIGLPLTLFQLADSDDYAVLEMGMNQLGEIARLTEIARPDIACITNIGEAHLEGLTDIDGVAMAKGELFEGVGPACLLAVNADDPRVVRLAEKSPQKKVYFGFDTCAAVRASDVELCGERGTSFDLHVGEERQKAQIASFGDHNVRNALAAAAICVCAGIKLDDIVHGLTLWVPYSQRFQVKKTPEGLKVVDDTYNANPSSMRAALQTVKRMAAGRRTVAILGDMLELGGHAETAHRQIGEAVSANGFTYLYALGGQSDQMIAGARAQGMPESSTGTLANHDRAVACVRSLFQQGMLEPGDWILVKGSRGMRMESIVKELCPMEKTAENTTPTGR